MISGGIFDKYKNDFLYQDKLNFPDLMFDINNFYTLISECNNNTMSNQISYEGKTKEEIIQSLANVFQSIPDWNSTKVAYNIIPSPMMSIVALNTLIQLYNPNAILDELSGGFVDCEKSVVKMLSDLAGWDGENTLGLSTFGGKGTLLYPIKIGINKICPNAIENGVDKDIVVLTGINNHYSITDICNFLGIGTKNCIRVNGSEGGNMDLEDLELKMEQVIKAGKKIACIIASGGETINHGMDDVKKIYEIREKIINKFNLSYIPHIHSDSVNGWIRLFFRDYNTETNVLGLEEEVIKAIIYHTNIMKTVEYADSYATDFHKTGLCPYVSAFFIAKNKNDLITISEANNASHNAGLIGDVLPCSYALEHSRSCMGIGSAYFILHYLGTEGFQKYLVYLLRIGFYIRNLIRTEYSDYFEIINDNSFWLSSVVLIKFDSNFCGFTNLIKSSEDQKNLYNSLSMQLLSKITERRKQGISKLYLGYIANHIHNGQSTNVHAFKLYPISLHYTEENCRELLDEVVTLIQEITVGGGNFDNIKSSDIHILR